MRKLLVATSNQHKLEEIREILKPLNLEIVGTDIFDENLEIIEDGNTYYENALIKAKAYADICSLPVIADDSGIEIAALNNEPGIFSARYLGEDTPYFEKNSIILEKLKGCDNRQAKFVSSIAYVDENKNEYSFQAEVIGKIANEISGTGGFGYDPIFMINEELSMADLTTQQKNNISHRALALKKFMEFIQDLNNEEC